MNIVILDDYQDAVRKLRCAGQLEPFNAKVYTNTVKGIGQLAVRLRDAEILVLIRERTHFPRALLEKLPRLRLIAQTGPVGAHIDLETCTRLGIAVAEGVGSPVAAAELTWALIMAAMRRLPQYIGNLKHGAWQQSGLKSASMPPNFGIGMKLQGKTLGVWGYGRIGSLVAGYGRAFGMQVIVWGSDAARAKALAAGHACAPSREALFEHSDVLTIHLRLADATRGVVGLDDLESEPILQGHPLLRLENAVCTPHLGYVEQDSYEILFGAAFENVIAFIANRPIRIVNRSEERRVGKECRSRWSPY